MKNITRQDLIEALKPLPHHYQLTFALYCAKDVMHLIKDENKEKANICINLVEKWLLDNNSVSKNELWIAYTAAYAAYTASAVYSNSAAYAIYTAYSTAAAATIAATYSTDALGYAADAVTIHKKDLNKYYSVLMEMIKEITPLEKVLYNLEGSK